MADASRCIFIQLTDISIFFPSISFLVLSVQHQLLTHAVLIARVEIFSTPDQSRLSLRKTSTLFKKKFKALQSVVKSH